MRINENLIKVEDNLSSTNSKIPLSANQGKVLNDKITATYNGWLPTGETWTYSSVDNPTGLITISGDKRVKYSLGMKIKFTNNSNIIYGFITKISYSSPNTTLTFIHEINPGTNKALHIMTNSAITNNYYSIVKSPYGFPASEDKWSIKLTDTTARAQSSPSLETWYNLAGINITAPLGLWKVLYSVSIASTASSSIVCSTQTTLSTTNHSASDNSTTRLFEGGPATQFGFNSVECNRPALLDLVAKTTYYFNIRTAASGISNIYEGNNGQPLIIKFICAYL